MCALGHVLESEGLATVSISLVREHAVAMRPPRSLWVPFPLGRPLGAAGDPGFQTSVLRRAFDLFGRPAGPVLEDFPDDAPLVADDGLEPWVCPVRFPRPQGGEGLSQGTLRETAALAPWYDIARDRRGRTTVGLSGLDPAAAARFLGAWLDGAARSSPIAGVSAVDALRWCGEDLKAFYFEAATARPGRLAASDLTDWFWRETAAGAMLRALRRVLLADADPGIREVGDYMLVAEPYRDD